MEITLTSSISKMREKRLKTAGLAQFPATGILFYGLFACLMMAASICRKEYS
jgi:hypothetical protein